MRNLRTDTTIPLKSFSWPRFLLGGAVVLIILLGGGSYSFPVQRTAAAVLAAIVVFAVLWRPAPGAALRWRGSDGFALACVVLLLVQTIPLPPALWSMLPGRESYAATDRAVFGALPWRTLSLDPARTLQALAVFFPALALYLAWRTGDEDRRKAILTAFCVAWLLTIALGLLQILIGMPGVLRLYLSSHLDLPTGIFANRNHQAGFIAAGLPLFVARMDLATRSAGSGRQTFLRIATLSAIALATLAGLATGSRSGGLAIAIVVPLVLWSIWRTRLVPAELSRRRGVRLGIVGAAVGAIVLVGAYGGAQAPTIAERLGQDTEGRYRVWPLTIEAIENHWLTGTGGGTFRRVYETVETARAVHPTFTNHAHSDWLEGLLEFGVAGALAAAWFALWLIRRLAAAVAMRRRDPSAALHIAWAGLAILVPLIHSSVDYPLRTISTMVLFWFAIALADDRSGAR